MLQSFIQNTNEKHKKVTIIPFGAFYLMETI